MKYIFAALFIIILSGRNLFAADCGDLASAYGCAAQLVSHKKGDFDRQARLLSDIVNFRHSNSGWESVTGESLDNAFEQLLGENPSPLMREKIERALEDLWLKLRTATLPYEIEDAKHVLSMFAKLKTRRSLETLILALQTSEAEQVRAAAAKMIGDIDGPLLDSEEYVNADFGEDSHPRTAVRIAAILREESKEDPSPLVQAACREALERIKPHVRIRPPVM